MARFPAVTEALLCGSRNILIPRAASIILRLCAIMGRKCCAGVCENQDLCGICAATNPAQNLCGNCAGASSCVFPASSANAPWWAIVRDGLGLWRVWSRGHGCQRLRFVGQAAPDLPFAVLSFPSSNRWPWSRWRAQTACWWNSASKLTMRSCPRKTRSGSASTVIGLARSTAPAPPLFPNSTTRKRMLRVS